MTLEEYKNAINLMNDMSNDDLARRTLEARRTYRSLLRWFIRKNRDELSKKTREE